MSSCANGRPSEPTKRDDNTHSHSDREKQPSVTTQSTLPGSTTERGSQCLRHLPAIVLPVPSARRHTRWPQSVLRKLCAVCESASKRQITMHCTRALVGRFSCFPYQPLGPRECGRYVVLIRPHCKALTLISPNVGVSDSPLTCAKSIHWSSFQSLGYSPNRRLYSSSHADNSAKYLFFAAASCLRRLVKLPSFIANST